MASNASVGQRERERYIIQQCMKSQAFWRRIIMKKPLYRYQEGPIELIKRHIVGNTGKIITVRMPRQTGKNEIEGEVEKWALFAYQNSGGCFIRTAPTYKPQIVNSKLRLLDAVRGDPMFKAPLKPMEGYIYQYGAAMVKFLSTDTRSNVVGDTASICLSIDEAHKVDEDKFFEDFVPMAAHKAVPIVMYGVAGSKNDLLYKTICQNNQREPELNISISVADCMAENKFYAKHYAEQVNRLGEDHPIIMTQYRLIDIDSSGGFLSPRQINQILSGDHQRLKAPLNGRTYYCTIDIAGEDEIEADGLDEAMAGRRDATVQHIWDVDFDHAVNGHPICRLVQSYVWVGKKMLGSDGEVGQQEMLLQNLKRWGCQKTVVDARGVGESVASYLFGRHQHVEKYKAVVDSVSYDAFGFLAMVNNNCIRMWHSDASPEWGEMKRELSWCSREISRADKMKINKPAPSKHIDMVKAATYIYRLVTEPVRSTRIRFV